LSDTLYEKPTHFLLELIQNADDNFYASGVRPTLRLRLSSRYGKDYFRTDCNEVGFSLKQLDSLLHVGLSTKKEAPDGRKGYIGEKGIGFKSVFKAGDVVYIKSGFYEFVLDRKEPLGMMRPILRRFPDAERADGYTTQLLLLLRDQNVYGQIQKDLESLEPQLLMFVQTLETLQVSIPGAEKTYSRHVVKFDDHLGGETMSIMVQDDGNDAEVIHKTKYLVQRYTVQGLPREPQREGVTATEVVVAFPVEQSDRHTWKRQKTFAFLPIDDFGFRFLIQADFILTANRGALQDPLAWNSALQDGIRKAFLMAVKRFNAVPAGGSAGKIRYAWPKYLEYVQSGSNFWKILHDGVIEDLKKSPILESRDEHAVFQKPDQLFYVPGRYRLFGDTLFDLPSIKRKHVSFAYDDHDVLTHLKRIGVKEQNIDDLFQEFETWMAEGGANRIKTQSVEWHTKVSSLFWRLGLDLKKRLKELPIIPLQDGSWAAPNTKHMYLPTRDQSHHVPTGIEISIVDEDASKSPYRHRFFTSLDLEECKPKQVCELIIELHSKQELLDRTDENLVLDAAYLFEHRTLLPPDGAPDICFISRASGKQMRAKSEVIYFIDPDVQPSLIQTYKDTEGSPFAVLDPKYEASICRGEEHVIQEFHRWLLRSKYSCFRPVPILVRNGELTPEWYFLKKNTVHLLLTVKFHCNNGILHPRLIKAVTELKVKSRGVADKALGPMGLSRMTMRALGTLALPTKELMQKCPHLDFAQLHNPTKEAWGFLSAFNVITTCDTTAWLAELKAISRLPADQVDNKAVHAIYRELSQVKSSEKDDVREIRKIFGSQPLVFVAKSNQSEPKWISHNDCVWRAELPLKRVARLGSRYKDCKALFRGYLAVKSASIQDVVDELCLLGDEECNDLAVRFEELVSLLQSFYSKEWLPDQQIRRIRAARVFPIVPGQDTSQEENDVQLCSLDTLGCNSRFLSKVVTETVKPVGDRIPNFQVQESLKIRLRHISCLSSEGDAEHTEEISRVHVWSVASLRVTRHLRCGSDDITVNDDNEESVSIQEKDDKTHIYIREDLSPSEAKTNYTIVEHFSELFEISNDNSNLVNLLIYSPIEDLPRIMEMHDLYVPEEQNDDSDADTQSAGSDDDLASERSSDDSDDNRVQEGENLEVEGDYTLPASLGSNEVPLLRDIFPSHKAISDRIKEKAVIFHMSDSLVARLPASAESSTPNSMPTISLPIRSQRNNPGPEYTVSPIRYRPVVMADRRGATSSRQPSPPGSRDDPLSVRNIRYRQIGYRGELFVYEILSRIVGWGAENWTSKMRRDAGYASFTGLSEKDFADFTYLDEREFMKEALRAAGVPLRAGWSHSTTYHLEVKTTQGHCAEPFFVSQNQVDLMRLYHNRDSDAYILLRVFNIDGERPGIKYFSNPWALYLNGILEFRCPPNQSYNVYQKIEAEGNDSVTSTHSGLLA
ncbi:hypothetical protein GQ53DRAFT_646961, partial [Thozetella sp. PMI_491]